MIRKRFFAVLFLTLFIHGCNKSTPVDQATNESIPVEATLPFEGTKMITPGHPLLMERMKDVDENGFLLTKEEARRALLKMMEESEEQDFMEDVRKQLPVDISGWEVHDWVVVIENWLCDLQYGNFEVASRHTTVLSDTGGFGLFEKDHNGEWIAIQGRPFPRSEHDLLTKEEARQALLKMMEESDDPDVKRVPSLRPRNDPMLAEEHKYGVERIENWACDLKEGRFGITYGRGGIIRFTGLFELDGNGEWIAVLGKVWGPGSSLSEL